MSGWMALIFAASISLDGVAVGVSYGMRKVSLPPLALTIIGIASSCVVMAAMLLGRGLTSFIPSSMEGSIDGALLCLVGLFLVVEACLPKATKGAEIAARDSKVEQAKQILQLKISSFKLVIHIIREPQAADVDKSGSISPFEAIFLGLALAVDAFVAGVAAGIAQLPLLTTSLSAGLMSVLFLAVGVQVGNWADGVWGSRLKSLPGLVLIIFGIVRLAQ